MVNSHQIKSSSHGYCASRERPCYGFTLIELLVVLAIIATLLSLAVPRYSGSVDKAKEAVLRQNLSQLREAIDKHYSDTGQYPATLDELIKKRYLRRIPIDPMTDSDKTWLTLVSPDAAKGIVFDVKSGSREQARDGSFYKHW